MSRDVHRQRVYDAEEAALGGTHLTERLRWDDVVATFEAVVHHPWWRSTGAGRPELQRARAGAARSSADGRRVRVADTGRDALTVAHELAHHLTVVTGPAEAEAHGPAFRAALVRLVGLVGGPVARTHLEHELARRDVPVGAWWLPEPPATTGLADTLSRAGPGRLRGAVPLPAAVSPPGDARG
jgi:hypothetical protein